MSRFGRRTFLASSAGVAAGAVAAGSLTGVGADVPAGASEHEGQLLGARASGAPTLRAAGLTVNGLTDPVGIDPDDCSFAWVLRAPGRDVSQGASRIELRRTDPGHTGVVWGSTVATSRQAFVPYDGPVLEGDAAYRWTVQVQAPGGSWGPVSAPARFTTGLRSDDWDAATWLEPQGGPVGPDRVTYLRSEYTPPAGRLVRATGYTSAAHTYRLYVDDVAVDAWPSFSYPDEQYVRAVDLTSRFRPGRTSAIGVLHRWYGAGQGRPESMSGLLFLLALHYADGSRVLHYSDGSWRQHPAEWLPSPQRNSDSGDFVEWVDGQAHPSGWASVGFDDRHWTMPSTAGFTGTPPFTATYAQRTSIEEAPVHPVRVHTLDNGAVVADFGAVYAARPRVSFASGVPGQTVSMRVGYLLDPDGQVSTLHGTQGTNLSMSYVMRSGAQAFEGFTYCGFRYLQVQGAGRPLRADDLVALTRHSGMPDGASASFTTSDRMLNAVWKVCARSCLFCSQEQFVDTPTREKGPFLWDGANESEGIMRAWGDQNQTWQALRDVERGQARYWPGGQVNAVYPNGDGARTFATSTARYPEWLWRYASATGDLTTVQRLSASVTRAVAWLWSTRQPSTGLLYGLADPDNGDPVYGYDLSVAADTASNVLAVNAMRRLALLATMTGDAAATVLWQGRATQLAAAVNAALRRSDGVYVDGIDANGAQSAHASQEANALALAYGVVPDASVAAVGRYVAGLGIQVGPNHGLELLRGLAAAGLYEAMVHTLTDTSVPGWAHSVAAGGTFTWEVWKPSDLIGDSLSHGWGSSALVAMQESLLGVQFEGLDEHGSLQVLVTPPASGLDRAQGSVPTIAGPVVVAWRRRGQGITMTLTVPVNVVASVRLPAGTPSSVREGGAPASKAAGVTVLAPVDGAAVLRVGSGTYTFTTI